MGFTKISVWVVSLLFLCFAYMTTATVQAAPLAPLGPHCIGSGPLPLDDPTFCGCTWGAVYYRGQPVVGATISLQFGPQITQTLVQKADTEPFPFYTLSGAKLGAKRSNLMTTTVEFAGQTATRTFRALPDSEGEQQITLVLPDQGVWTPWISGGYTRTLAVNGSTLWAGGPAGLLAVDRTSGISVTQNLPWSNPVVVGITSADTNHQWVIGPHNLAKLNNGVWQNQVPPFAASLRALVLHPTTGALWLGGGDSTGALAIYDGSWHMVSAVSEPVTTLLVDSANNVWVGTFGGGLYRHIGTVADLNSGWTHFTINDGLASDYVLATAASGDSLWFGTSPYFSGQGYHSGISRYKLSDNSWHTYTITDGLPADLALSQATAAILSLTVDAQGVPWVGTQNGIYRLATPAVWVQHVATGGMAVRALVANGNLLIGARSSGQLDRLDLTATPGNPPTATIAPVSTPVISPIDLLTLAASAVDHDEPTIPADAQILAWDWRSNRDGPLCTTATTCQISGRDLSLGVHTISLRVQDNEGVWSQPVTTTITVTKQSQVYLPLVERVSVVQN